jgi:acyl-coenzyme A synthetase/AMP-(fatty) acid ligase
MGVELPEIYNAATTFVDENITQGRGGRIAIYYQDEAITYQEVYEKVNRTGNALKELGVEIEHRVLLALPDSPEFAYSFFGAIKIGAVPIPTNPLMAAKDYEYLINDSRARAIIVHESVLPEIAKIWDNTRYLKHILVVGKGQAKARSYQELIARASDYLEPEPTHRDDVGFWGYTSGSTGVPKGAVHLQHDMITITDLFVKTIDVFRHRSFFFLTGWATHFTFPFASAPQPCSGPKNRIRKKFFRSSINTSRRSSFPCRRCTRDFCESRRNTT